MSIEVPVEFNGKFDKVLDNFDKFNSQVAKKTEQTADVFSLMETAAKGFIAGFTIKKILDGLDLLKQKGVESEEAVRKLTSSLIATDSATNRNVKAFSDLADEMARTSRFDDELVLSQVAIAKQFGVTNKEADKLIRVAVDLASATDGDLNSAVRNLGMTLDGTAGKLANQFPILQRLTAAQLRNGEAINLLGKQYAGAGLRSIEGYKGQTTQLWKEFDNLLERVGLIIVQNPAVIASLEESTERMAGMTEAVDKNADSIGRWLTRLFAVKKAIGSFVNDLIHGTDGGLEIFRNAIDAYNKTMDGAVKISDLFGGTMDNLARRFDPVTGKFVDFKNKMTEAAKQVGSFNAVSGKIGDIYDESGTKFNRFAADAKKDFEELEKKLKDIGKTELDTMANEYRRNIKILENARRSMGLDRKTEVEYLGKLELKYAQDVAKYKEQKAKELEELAKKNFADMVARAQQAFDNPFQSMVDQRYGERNYGSIGAGTQQGLAQAGGIARSMLGGEEGARNLLSEGVGAIASIWLGPFGKVIGELVGELSKGPEHVKKMMTEFFDSMPVLIENLILALDQALLTFLEKWPEFLERMLDRLPEIVDRLIENLPKLFEAIGRYILKIGELFLIGILKMIWKLIEGAGKFVGKILEGAGRFIGKIIEGAGRFIDELVKGIGKKIGKAFGGGTGLDLGGGRNFDFTGGWGSGDTTSIITGGLSSLFKTGAQGKTGGAGASGPLVVNVAISGKQLAQAIVDLRQMGHKV